MVFSRFVPLIALLAGVVLSTPAIATPHLSIDLDSGRVVSHQQAFDAWYPASLTKLMTAYVVFRALESGEIAADSPVRVSKSARKQPPSRMAYRPGTVLTVENALRLLIIKSANDIAVAIAESVAGSVPRFANRMNREAARLGMTGSRFVNPHGLHDQRQVTTARDLALLVRALHQEFPRYQSMFETPAVLAPQRTKSGQTIQRVHYSYNLLLERYRGADGFKTGFVCASGYNYIGAATRAGRRVAAIVLGRDSQTSRAVDAAKLITEAFQMPLSAGTPISALEPETQPQRSPRNMRPVLCTAEARAARYEPGAGKAVIDSPWLQPRSISRQPVKVTLGGASGSVAAPVPPVNRVPVPSFRPAGLRLAAQTQIEGVVRISRGPFTLPTFRPGT